MSSWKSTKNHWTNKPDTERKSILDRVSKGWLGRPKDRIKCKCLICGKEFEVKKSRVKAGRGKYCSKDCQYKGVGLKERGNKHWNWRGGITTESEKIRKSVEYRLWREAVFARDSWTCQKCLEKGGELVSHHINNFADYPELRTAISNGVTFCEKCHNRFHKVYGVKNNTGEQLKNYVNSKNIK